jgi:N-acetylmuramoyl-L-alanine amidase
MKTAYRLWCGVFACALFCGVVEPVQARAQHKPVHHATAHHAQPSPRRGVAKAGHRTARIAKARPAPTRQAATQAGAKHAMRSAASRKPASTLAATKHGSPSRSSAASRNAPPPISVAATRAAPHRAAQVGAKKPLILIDAGHGGIDSGAVGITGTLEKTVTLAAARELRRQLLATGRYRVALTRDSDGFVPLARRVALIRAYAPSMFISIHADSSHDHGASGASIYVRSNGGAAVATVSGDSAPVAVAAPIGAPALQDMLIDSLNDDIRMTADPAREARLYVLGVSAVPSVLLEMGFLSNRHDEARLRQAKYQAQIAAAIREAVDAYFSNLTHGHRSRV